MSEQQRYLQYTGEGKRTIEGVGVFAKDTDPQPVSESITTQYDTEEMRALGWVVTQHFHIAAYEPTTTPEGED